MFKLIKLHFFYIWNKRNLLLMVGVILILFLISFISTLDLNKENIISINNYNENFIVFSKIMLTFTAILLMGMSFLSEHDNYRIVYLSARPKPIVYVITKIFTIAFCFLFISFISLLIYIICGLLLTKTYYVTWYELNYFIMIVIIAINYGIEAIIWILIGNNIIYLLLPFIFFLSAEIWQDNYIDNSLIQFLLPNANMVYLELDNYLKVILLIIINFCFLLIIFYFKRFKN